VRSRGRAQWARQHGIAGSLASQRRSLAARPPGLFADRYDQFLAERHIAATGQQVIAVYHPYPDGGATLSSEDIAASGPRHRLPVVVALTAAGSTDPVVRAYPQSTLGTVVEVLLRIVGCRNEDPSARGPVDNRLDVI
jgi:proteasome lid subunit RPN8/RPN11